MIGVALSGIFTGAKPSWVTDPQADIDLAISEGLKAFSLPVWYDPAGGFTSKVIGGTRYTVAGLAAYIAGKGAALHLVPQLYAADSGMIWASAGKYESFVQDILQGVQIHSGTTFDIFNEPSDPTGSWGRYDALYTGLGNQVAQVVSQAGCLPLYPIPGDMSAGNLKAMLRMGTPPILDFGMAHGWSMHLYKVQLTNNDPLMQMWDQHFAVIDALRALDPRPIYATEYGGSAPGPSLSTSRPGAPVPDAATYGTLAAGFRARGITSYAWQARDAGDGLAVLGHPAVVSAIVGPSPT